jgi:hypothetical protein
MGYYCLYLVDECPRGTLLVPDWRVQDVPGVSKTYLACPRRTWRVQDVPGVSKTYLACPRRTWRVQDVPGVSKDDSASGIGGSRVQSTLPR